MTWFKNLSCKINIKIVNRQDFMNLVGFKFKITNKLLLKILSNE